jgi:hypothetical protein
LSQATTRTLTFSRPVDNLFFAVVSLNGNGCGYWGCGNFEKVGGGGTFDLDAITDPPGPNYLSSEPHGVIQFQGSISSMSWTSLTADNWNGFTALPDL